VIKEALFAVEQPAFTQHRRVAFQDVDAAGIVFFARILVYFHEAYAAFLEARGLDLPDLLKSKSWLAPLGHCEADFLRPLTFGDRIAVEIAGGRFEETQLTIGYRIKKESGEVAAVGTMVHVFVDRKTFKRTPLPAEDRAKLELQAF
jgi:1,4-dihydroxy-2-naphthoyl-CoA hydrolase